MSHYSAVVKKTERQIEALKDKVNHFKRLDEEANKKRIEATKKWRKMKQEKRDEAIDSFPIDLFEDIPDIIEKKNVIISTKTIDIFQGLSDDQKRFIETLIKNGFSPMGFSVYPDGEIYYYGKIVAIIRGD